MTSNIPEWAESALRFPLSFAQVREDPWLDERAAALLKPGFSAILIASGGCTAAWLAAKTPAARLHLVDVNPAQIALARLKLHLLRSVDPHDRLRGLGHAPMLPGERSRILAKSLHDLGLPIDSLGPLEEVSRLGPDHAGRYEILFARLRDQLAEDGVGQDIAALLQLSDPEEQARRSAESSPLGRALDSAFRTVMPLETLVRLFGNAATQNRVEPFASHFARRTRQALANFPANSNPYLWQALRGSFPGCVKAPWLDASPPGVWPRVTWTIGAMKEALEAEPGTFDFVHLSNILDWLSEQDARATLKAAWNALSSQGALIVRQLNSTLDIRGLESGFEWDSAFSAALHGADRSYFYRAIHVGRKA